MLTIKTNEEGKRELIPLRWGLVPAWSKGPDNRYSMINARADTVSGKPAYRNAFKHRQHLARIQIRGMDRIVAAQQQRSNLRGRLALF